MMTWATLAAAIIGLALWLLKYFTRRRLEAKEGNVNSEVDEIIYKRDEKKAGIFIDNKLDKLRRMQLENIIQGNKRRRKSSEREEE